MEYLSLYGDFVKIKFKSMVEYPGAFWAFSIAKMLGWGAGIAIMYLTIYRFGSVMSWSAFEVMLLYSINVIAYALAGFFMYHPFTKLSAHVRDGSFDEMLTKPLNPFVYLCCREFSTGYFANLIVGLIGLVVCFVNLGVKLSFGGIVYLIIILIGTGLIHSGFIMLANIPSFWLVKITAFHRLYTTLEEFIRYPVSIYDKWIQIMLTFVFPMAFVNFYPAQYFIQKDDFLMFHPIFAHFTPFVGAALALAGYAFFNFGIKNYTSTGS